MTNLGGHDIETLIDTLRAEADGDQPTCFIAYTIKGMGLPFAGHKDNHAGLMTKEQMEEFRTDMGIRPGHEWDLFEGLDASPEELRAFLEACPFATKLTPEGRTLTAPVRAGAGGAADAEGGRAEDVHPGRVRRHPGRDRPRARAN